MTEVDRLLLGHFLDALEPGEAVAAARLLRNPTHAAQVAAWRGLGPPPPVEAPTWRIPPPRTGTMLAAQAAAVFGGPCRPGDLVELRLMLPDARERVAIVLWRVADRWAAAPGPPVPVVALARIEDVVLIHVVAPDEVGTHRVAVALPPTDTPAGQGDVDALREGIADGSVPVGAQDVEVTA